MVSEKPHWEALRGCGMGGMVPALLLGEPGREGEAVCVPGVLD